MQNFADLRLGSTFTYKYKLQVEIQIFVEMSRNPIGKLIYR